MPQHRIHPLWKRAFYSTALIVGVVGFGTVSLHSIEHYSYLESFFFMSMLATGQGPPIVPATNLGKIFTSVMAFVSVGTVVFSLGFLFGPFFGKLIRIGGREIQKEERALMKDVRGYEKRR